MIQTKTKDELIDSITCYMQSERIKNGQSPEIPPRQVIYLSRKSVQKLEVICDKWKKIHNGEI